jgi:thiol-disulfide isomerase/thioredoxin
MMQTMIRIVLMALAVVDPSVQVRDVNGGLLRPFATTGKARILFFLSTECPISRFYAPEIQRICDRYGDRGVACSLIYEDLPLEPAAVRKHLAEFGYQEISAAIDQTGAVAEQAGAVVTPQAIIIDKGSRVRYSGRIDNFYADLGKPRRQTTSHDLTDAVDEVLEGRAVAHPQTNTVGCFIPKGGTK